MIHAGQQTLVKMEGLVLHTIPQRVLATCVLASVELPNVNVQAVIGAQNVLKVILWTSKLELIDLK